MLSLDIEDCSDNPKEDHLCNNEELESLRRKIFGDQTLVSRTDDEFLLAFLRGRKFVEDDAFKYIKKYYEAKWRYPAVFKNFVPSDLQKFLDANIAGNLKTTDGTGKVILVGIASRWDPSALTLWQTFRGFLLILELLLTDDLVQRNGIILIADFRNITWRHMVQFTPNFLYTAKSCMIGSYPLRYKQLHMVIGENIAYWLSSMVIHLAPKKLRERLFIHTSDFSSLHKVVEPKYLPSDFGGELSSFDASHCSEKLKKNEQYFKDCELYWTQHKPK